MDHQRDAPPQGRSKNLRRVALLLCGVGIGVLASELLVPPLSDDARSNQVSTSDLANSGDVPHSTRVHGDVAVNSPTRRRASTTGYHPPPSPFSSQSSSSIKLSCPRGLLFHEEMSFANFDIDRSQHKLFRLPEVHIHATTGKGGNKVPGTRIPRTIIHVLSLDDLVPSGMKAALDSVAKINHEDYDTLYFGDRSAQAYLERTICPQGETVVTPIRPAGHDRSSAVANVSCQLLRAAFRSLLVPHRNRAELFSWVYLYKFGGVALEAGHTAGSRMPLKFALGSEAGFVTSVQQPSSNKKGSTYVHPGFVASAPGHPVLESLLLSALGLIEKRQHPKVAEGLTGSAAMLQALLHATALGPSSGHLLVPGGNYKKGVFLWRYEKPSACLIGKVYPGASVIQGRSGKMKISEEWRTEPILLSRYASYGAETRWYRLQEDDYASWWRKKQVFAEGSCPFGVGLGQENNPLNVAPEYSKVLVPMVKRVASRQHPRDLTTRPDHPFFTSVVSVTTMTAAEKAAVTYHAGLKPRGAAAVAASSTSKEFSNNQHQQQAIPKILFQTNKKDQVPKDMRRAMQSLIDMNPEYTYHYFSDSAIRPFIQKYFPTGDVLRAFDALIPGAFRSDLFRYCFLYIHGGVYLDADVLAVLPLSELLGSEDEFVSAEDSGNGWVHNALLGAAPRNPIIKVALDTAVDRITRCDYGRNPLSVTGPMLLRDVVGNRLLGLDAAVVSPEFLGRKLRIGYYEALKMRLLPYTRGTYCSVGQIEPLKKEKAQLASGTGVVVLWMRYPTYKAETRWYNGDQSSYHELWRERRIFDPEFCSKPKP